VDWTHLSLQLPSKTRYWRKNRTDEKTRKKT